MVATRSDLFAVGHIRAVQFVIYSMSSLRDAGLRL
jgi:hypothetical protein